MCAGSAASTREGERLASKASSCARCLRRSIWDSTIPSTKGQGGASVRLVQLRVERGINRARERAPTLRVPQGRRGARAPQRRSYTAY